MSTPFCMLTTIALGASNGAMACAVAALSVVFTQNKNDIGAANGFELIGCFDADAFFEVKRVEQEAIGVDCGGEWGAADHDDGGSGASEHAAEVAADGASADDGDFWPVAGVMGQCGRRRVTW